MIGYYAHHHGSGHANYAHLMAKEFGEELTIFTSAEYPFQEGTIVVNLAQEDPHPEQWPKASAAPPPYLHYSPVGNKDILRRSQQLLQGLIEKQIQLLIVDVSVEIAALARACSMPYAYVRMFGARHDLPHQAAYEGASFLLAYYPEDLEPAHTPTWVREKTLYLDFFSQFSLPDRVYENALDLPDNYWLYVQGFGGNTRATAHLQQLTTAFPEQAIVVVGPVEEEPLGEQVQYTGVVGSIGSYVRGAELVFGACGSNITAELATLGAPFIAIPEARPFEEQEYLAKALERLQLATVWRNQSAQEVVKKAPLGGDIWAPYVQHNAVSFFYNWIQQHTEDLKGLEHQFPRQRPPHISFDDGQNPMAL